MATRLRNSSNTAGNEIHRDGRTSPPEASRRKVTEQQVPNCKKETSGHTKKSLLNKHIRVTKIDNEDKNYLAHGTGIPR